MNTMTRAPGALTDLLEEAFDRRRAAASTLIDQAGNLALACRALADRFRAGGRLLTFGIGTAAADAQHVAVEFMHPVIVGKRALRLERQALEEAGETIGRSLDLDADAGRVVYHSPGEVERAGQAVNEGPEAHALHHSLDANPESCRHRDSVLRLRHSVLLRRHATGPARRPGERASAVPAAT
jgi:hypothetical protein